MKDFLFKALYDALDLILISLLIFVVSFNFVGLLQGLDGWLGKFHREVSFLRLNRFSLHLYTIGEVFFMIDRRAGSIIFVMGGLFGWEPLRKIFSRHFIVIT
jgi:hypothetical protein